MNLKMERAAALLSLAVAGVGVWWWVSPSSYPFGARDRVTVSLSHLFEHDVAGMMMVVAGVVGVAAVLLRNRWLAAVEVLFFGVVMSDAGIISALGYLFSLGAPVAVAGFLVVACVRRQRSGFIALGVVVVLAVAGVASGLLTGDVFLTYAATLATSFSSYGERIAWTFANTVAFGVWLVVAIRAFGGPSSDRASDAGWTRPESAARWGRVVTIAAALCPLPYAIYRLTWLTPWPVQDLQGGSLTMPMRLQGSVIAVSAIIAAVLTLGLISRWGEVFPRWIPIFHGRPVPVRFPVLAGGVMAGMFFLAGTGMVVNAIERDSLIMIALFPYPLWGVLLAAAVFAYWLRRRSFEPVTR